MDMSLREWLGDCAGPNGGEDWFAQTDVKINQLLDRVSKLEQSVTHLTNLVNSINRAGSFVLQGECHMWSDTSGSEPDSQQIRGVLVAPYSATIKAIAFEKRHKVGPTETPNQYQNTGIWIGSKIGNPVFQTNLLYSTVSIYVQAGQVIYVDKVDFNKPGNSAPQGMFSMYLQMA